MNTENQPVQQTYNQHPNLSTLPVSAPPTKEPHEVPKQNNSALIFFSTLLIILVGIIAYLGFQNYVLQKEVDSLKAVPSPTPLVSPKPTATAEDPTINWKTYRSPNNSYSFKYPSDWSLRYAESDNVVFMANGKGSVGIVISDHQYPYGFGPGSTFNENSFSVSIDGQTFPAKEVTGPNKAYVDLAITNPGELHIIFGTGYPVASVGDNNASLSDYLSSRDTIIKILSTFQLTSASASPSSKPVACTQEAKICPDGISVGRTGPNCNFAPCPGY